jgi:hypothetical protein
MTSMSGYIYDPIPYPDLSHCCLMEQGARPDSWFEQSFAEQPQEQHPIRCLEDRMSWFA